MNNGKKLITALIILAAASPGIAEDSPRLMAQLRELKPLPKVHYSWPLPFKTLSDDLLAEYVRLTHAVSVSGEWHDEKIIDRAVRVCKQVNADKPKIPASIGVNYSVWHRRFGKDLPPTDTGPTHQKELDYLQERLNKIKAALATSNKAHETDVKVSCVLFDSERFFTREGDETWNAAMTAKYDAAYKIVRETFPKVRIEWYGRGAVQPGASPTGWSRSRLFTLKEQGESFGCSLYCVPELGHTRETYRRTAKLAAEHNCNEVTPWIALASGYRKQVDKFHEWSMDWNYDLVYSWKLGAEVNHPWFGAPERHQRFAPWNKAKVAAFYPEPFGRTPHWGKHFIAYVRGAHLIKKLPEEK